MISFFAHFSGRPWKSGVSLPRRQRGVSIITGVFLLLLMSVLAAVIANVVSTAHVNMAADIGGARAYQAARAGVEWGMFQLDPNAQGAGLPACVNGTPAIPGHAVTVTCQSWDTTEGTRQLRFYRIVSQAIAAGVKAPGIERQVEVTLEKCRDPASVVAPYDC
jgi:MSHA biogenesis protein MshP